MTVSSYSLIYHLACRVVHAHAFSWMGACVESAWPLVHCRYHTQMCKALDNLFPFHPTSPSLLKEPWLPTMLVLLAQKASHAQLSASLLLEPPPPSALSPVMVKVQNTSFHSV